MEYVNSHQVIIVAAASSDWPPLTGSANDSRSADYGARKGSGGRAGIRPDTTAACCTAASITSPGRRKRGWRCTASGRWSSSASENAIPHEICGKLVVAADEAEVPRLRDLHERGTANGLEGLRWLGREEMREIEPHVGGVAALRVPQEGIVDYARVCAALVAKLTAARNEVVTSARVVDCG